MIIIKYDYCYNIKIIKQMYGKKGCNWITGIDIGIFKIVLGSYHWCTNTKIFLSFFSFNLDTHSFSPEYLQHNKIIILLWYTNNEIMILFDYKLCN